MRARADYGKKNPPARLAKKTQPGHDRIDALFTAPAGRRTTPTAK